MTASEGRELIPGHVPGEELARGGMSIVYRARQLSPDRAVAVKMLRPHLLEQPAMRDRFRQEAQAAAGLQHPGILPVYQVGGEEGLPWFTMMLAEGGTLAARRADYAGKWRATAELIAGLARAVGHAHDFGVLHRDIKPGNILFDAAGRAYVCDFGLAKVATAGETTPDWTLSVQLLGTPHYMPPEIAGGTLKQATTAGDIYALGVMLYELLAGHLPYDAENVPSLLRKIADEEPSSLGGRRNGPSVQSGGSDHMAPALPAPPADLSAIAMKCLEKRPAARYPTAGALANDLEAWLAGKPVTARRLSRSQKFGRWVRRNPVVAGLSAALAAAVLTGAVYGWQKQRSLSTALALAQLREAEFRNRAADLGLRDETLALLAESARYAPPAEAERLRTEIAAALARPELVIGPRWKAPLPFSTCQGSLTPDFSLMAWPRVEGGAVVWRLPQRTVVYQTEHAPEDPAHLAAISPDGHWLGLTWEKGGAELHDLSGISPVRTWPARSASYPRIGFAPDSLTASVHSGRTIRLLDLTSGTERALPGEPGPSTGHSAFSPDSRRLAVTQVSHKIR